MSKTVTLAAIASLCSACDSKQAAPAPDPWTGSAAPTPAANDPWGATPPAPSRSPAPTEPPPSTAATGLPEGDWRCDLTGTTWMNGQRYTQTMPLNGFSLRGSAWTSEKEGSGTVEVEAPYATFHGGGFDNWRGAFNHHKDGSLSLVFAGDNHRDGQPEHGPSVNDIECSPAH